MPKFMLLASYSADGAKGLLKEGGTSRRATIEKLVEGLGGKLEAFYFAFGGEDVVVIADLPDQKTAAAIGLSVHAGGTGLKTVVLLTPEEIDDAVKTAVELPPAGGLRDRDDSPGRTPTQPKAPMVFIVTGWREKKPEDFLKVDLAR